MRAAAWACGLFVAGCATDDAGAPATELGTSEGTGVATTAPATTASSAPVTSAATEPTQPGTLPLVLAVDAVTGRQRFAVPIDAGAQTFSGIVVADGVVAGLAGRCDGQSAAAIGFDASTGELLWTVPLPGGAELSEPTSVDGGVLVVATARDATSFLSGIDVASGRLLWEADLGPKDEVTTVLDGPAVVVMSQSVRDPGGPFELAALDRSTGERLWEQRLPGPFHLAASGDVVLYQALGGLDPAAAPAPLLGLDAKTGIERWRVVDVRPSWTPAVGAGVVVDSVTGGGVVAYNLDTGLERWRRPDLELPEIGDGSSAFAGGHALFTRAVDPGLHNLEIVDLATGQTAFAPPGDGQVVAITPGALLLATPPSGLTLYRVTDGSRIGQIELPPPEPDQVFVQPAVGGDGTAYVGRGCPGRR